MKRRWMAGGLVATLLLASSTASADPGTWGQLGQVILWLEKMNTTLANISGVMEDIRDEYSKIYPGTADAAIQTLFEPVESVKNEVEKLACGWRFTPRVEKLRLALFEGRSFCREEWNLMFGPPALTVDWDLESYYDWSAVRRFNLIATRNTKSEQRAADAHWLATEAIKGRDPADPTQPFSPGYAQRLSALGAAELGNTMVEMGDTQTAMLDLEQEAVNDKRRRRLLDHVAAMTIYADMAQRKNLGATGAAAPVWSDR